MKKGKVASIVVAAGYSSRMGDFKPFLKFGEYTVVETIINTLKSAGVDDIILVSGFRGDEVIKKFKASNITCVTNENYSKGMFTSIVKGIEYLPKDIDAFLMLPVDIPLVKKHTIGTIISEYFHTDKGIIYPTFFGEKGHPPMIDNKYKNTILKSSGDGGLKKILENFEDDSQYLIVPDEAILMDMDTKEDYKKLLNYYYCDAPNIKECEAILKISNVSDNIVGHCKKVSEVALNILKCLNDKEYELSEAYVSAAALLHDIAKGQKKHDKIGAMMLKEMGYERVSSIISTHTDIIVNENEKINENEVLYLADKIVKGEKIVSVEERFERCLKEYENNSEVISKVRIRYDSAVKIKKKIDTIIGKEFIYE